MTLRARFLVAFVAAALVPLIVVGWWSRKTTVERAREDYARRLAATVDAARRRVEERAEQDDKAVGRLCERDFLVDRLILDLAAERFGPAQQEQLVALLPSVQRSLALDSLEILHAGGQGPWAGRVLASAHYPGRAGARDPELVAAASARGEQPFVDQVRLREGGEVRSERALLTACTTERDGVRLAIVGGRFLDARFVETLLGDVSPVRLVLTGPEGHIPPWVSARGGREEVWAFLQADGDAAARLVAVIDDALLRERLAELDRVTLWGGIAALLAALVLGGVLVLGLTRPLGELERAARRVGEGDLESVIDVRHRGEVGRALQAFNRMTSELKATRVRLLRAERIAAWRDIARRIAHEIKNPLSPIQVSIETMRKTYAKRHPDFDEIFEESTTAILEEVERLKRIVSEFSRFARLPRPKPEWLDLREVVDHVVGLHRGGEVEVTTELEDVEDVRADREQLIQVIVNLVQNGIDAARARHGSRGGRVHVAVEPATDTAGALLRVSDNGPGIPPDDRDRIFEPYYTSKAGGTGLGLAIVHRIVGDHGGSIEVTESPEGGAELEVKLRPEGPPPAVEASMSDTAVPLVRTRHGSNG